MRDDMSGIHRRARNVWGWFANLGGIQSISWSTLNGIGPVESPLTWSRVHIGESCHYCMVGSLKGNRIPRR